MTPREFQKSPLFSLVPVALTLFAAAISLPTAHGADEPSVNPSRLIPKTELKLNSKFPSLPPGDLQVEAIEGGTVYLTSKSKKATGLTPIKTDLVDIEVVSWFHLPKPATSASPVQLNPHPYLLVSARTCAACPAAERSLFFLRVASGLEPVQLSYPGRIVDTKKGQVVLESRSFYGECLRTGGSVFVSFQSERIDKRNKFHPSVYVAEPQADFVHERQIEKALPSFKETLARVKQGKCVEVSGRNRTTLEKPLDLLIQREADVPDDESAADRTEEKGEVPGEEAQPDLTSDS